MINNKDLVNLIQKYSGQNDIIFENTRINEDLQIKGEKAMLFIGEYARLFNVDISSFAFPKYFLNPDNSNDSEADIPYLTAGDLERGILTGILNEQIISLHDHDSHLPPKFTATNISLGILLMILIAILLIFVTIFL